MRKHISSVAYVSVTLAGSLTLAGSCFVRQAQAGVISIDFNSLTAGNIAGQTESGSGAGAFGVNDSPASNAQKVVSGDLTYTGLPAQSGTAQSFNDEAGGDNANALAWTTLTAPLTGTIWYSYLGRLSVTTKRLGVTFNQSSATNATSQNSDATSFLVGGNTFRLRSAGTNVATGGTVAANTTYLVLGRITFGGGADDTITQWINPNLAAIGSTPTDAVIDANSGTKLTASTFNFTSNQISSIGLFSYQSGYGGIDRVRLSNATGDQAYFDVTTAVPEPASLSLLTIGGLLILWRKRQSNTPSVNRGFQR